MNSLDGPDELRQGTPKNYITLWKKGILYPPHLKRWKNY
jgi:hypothetical protein